GEMIGKNAVLDRPEQRSDDAKEEQRDEQQRHRMQAEADNGDEGNADLAEFESPRHHRLVVAIGELAAQRREEEVRRNENRGGKRDQRLGVGAADMEQNEKDQRVLEEVVAERREKLGPEQGREAPRHQQRRGHGFSAGSKTGAGGRPSPHSHHGNTIAPSPRKRGEGTCRSG